MIQTNVKDIKPNKYYNRHIYTVYSLVNLDNGKRYIGRTGNLGRRLRDHFNALKIHKHRNPFLNKDSDCNFGFEVLEENILFRDRTEKERHYIQIYQTYKEDYGYNVKDPCVRKIKKDAKSISIKT